MKTGLKKARVAEAVHAHHTYDLLGSQDYSCMCRPAWFYTAISNDASVSRRGQLPAAQQQAMLTTVPMPRNFEEEEEGDENPAT